MSVVITKLLQLRQSSGGRKTRLGRRSTGPRLWFLTVGGNTCMKGLDYSIINSSSVVSTRDKMVSASGNSGLARR